MNDKLTYQELEKENAILNEKLRIANSIINSQNINQDIHLLFLNTLNDFFWLLDEQGNIIFVNDYVVHRLGYTREELYKMNVLTVHPPERRNEASKIVGEMLQGVTEFCPIPVFTKTGKYIPVETRVVKGLWNNQNVIFGISKDISELKLSEEKFSKAFHINSNLTAISEFETGKYIDVNQKFLDTFQLKRDEVIGRTSVELNLFEATTRKELLTKFSKNDSFTDYEMEINYKGKVIHGLFSAHSFYLQDKKCWITIMLDITERKKAEILQRKNEKIEAQNDEFKRLNEALKIAKEKTEYINERLQSIFLAASTCIGIIKNRIITEVNELFFKLLGYEPNEIIGKSASIIYPNIEEYERVGLEKYKQIELYGTGSIETVWMKKNGELVNIFLSSTPLNLNDLSNGMTFTALDITKRKQIENEMLIAKEKAEESKQLFKSLIENAPDGVVILDKSGKFKYGSPNAIRHFGYSRKDFIGHLGEEFAHPDDMPLISKTFETIFANPEVKPTVKYRFKRKNGEFRWLETTFTNLLSDKYINGIVLNFSDITERKQIEIELLKSKEHFKAIFEQASAGIGIALPNGKIINSNPKFAEILGYSIDELLTKSAFDITFPGDMQKEKLLIRQVLDRNFDTFFIEKRYIHKNGHTVWAYLSSNVVKDENGDIEYVIGVVIDISEQKKIENELIVAKDKAEESDRLKSAFLQNMSHEVRTPLNAIVGFSQLLTNENQSIGKIKKYSDMISSSSKKLIDIISDVIEISQIQAKLVFIKNTDFDLIKIVMETIQEIKSKLDNKEIDFIVNSNITGH